MRIGTALAFLGVVVSPLVVGCITTCQVANPNDYVEAHCPVTLTPVLLHEAGGPYSECVTVRVWMEDKDLSQSPKIHIHHPVQKIIWPVMKKNKTRKNTVKCRKGVKQQVAHNNTSLPRWLVLHDCVKAGAQQVVSVSYSTTSTSCNVSYLVPDPIPDFDLSVNRSSKFITITVEPGKKVHSRLCYRINELHCSDVPDVNRITIDPSQSRSAHFSIPYLLPCVCVEVYYTYIDARRHRKCPFLKERLADVGDIWQSSSLEPYESGLQLSLQCAVSELPVKISASLCWKQHEHLCTPIQNLTLKQNYGPSIMYNTSAVDRHPQMCVQFSLGKVIHKIYCPFMADMSSWDVYISPSRQQSVTVYVTTIVPAVFSAQFCVPNMMGCTSIGPVHPLKMEGDTSETGIHLPPHLLAEQPCVQVWQSDPALLGRRILCLDYTHNRHGIYAVTALILIAIAVFLGICIHRFTKNGAAGWLHIQKPVLLVCSSEQSAHVSAVCALASILQGELSATVHMALWAHSSQRHTGVADLGPLPWLYGQWDDVRKAQGKVLIIWSPEAKKTYKRWRGERVLVDKSESKKEDYSKAEVRHKKIKLDVEIDYKLTGKRLGKCKMEKMEKKDCVNDDKDGCLHKEPSAVTAPVFAAALACLEGALQQPKGQEVAVVYFKGLGHSRDIPKAFRGVPQYCLPQDFSSLIQELRGMRRQTKTGKLMWHCWPRLLSKVLSLWLARKLSHRLQTLLLQTQRKKTQEQNVTSSQKMMSDRTQSRLKLLLAANMAWTGPAREQEPLRESP